ncbi:hypothetical protein CPT03_17580 [Pedobacter ginsengisoli]|uniref:Uncharacterized protein n=1 Tax=Pedobacter ginsengisoli TaxID=363852 RepID=A0A2D1U982_9SPHI|nr:hypothetical protein [Pedobacter ginsengisoli]ATP58146.1 hypothetical protein CPT03_17580 [Pedobacter ginsengisoli]
MKNKISKLFIAVFATVVLFSSCKKNDPDHWLKDNITIVGKVPVVAGFTVKPPQTTNVAAGASVQLDLRYWSDEQIDKINLRSTVGANAQALVSTTPYQKAYSTVSRTDSLLLGYQVPGDLAKGTSIVMEVEVVNKNTLTKKQTLTLKIQ